MKLYRWFKTVKRPPGVGSSVGSEISLIQLDSPSSSVSSSPTIRATPGSLLNTPTSQPLNLPEIPEYIANPFS